MSTRTKKNTYSLLLYGVLVLLTYLFLHFISNEYIFNKQFYVRSLSDRLTSDSLTKFLNIQSSYSWISYLSIFLMSLLGILYTTVCVSIGAVLAMVDFKFRKILKVSLLAETVFIIAQIIYLFELSLHSEVITLESVSYYYPLSLLSYFGTQNVVAWLQYPLQTLNLFEVAYMVVIAWLLSRQWKEDFMESLAVVVPSYATGLFLWLIFITFVTLQVS